MVRSLANVRLKKVWARLLILRQRLLQEEENSKKQKESRQEIFLADLALFAKEQIQNITKIRYVNRSKSQASSHAKKGACC